VTSSGNTLTYSTVSSVNMSYNYESTRDFGAAERPDTSSDEQLAWLAQQEEAERVRTGKDFII
jgi:hypothetical protein